MLARMKRPSAKWLWLLPVLLFAGAFFDHPSARSSDWRSASRGPVGLAPDPAGTAEAVIQVYAARAVRWRGYFGVHTWVAVKPQGAPAYTVYEVNGWRLRRTGSSVVASDRPPDSRWFGSAPTLIAERRGAGVHEMTARIEAAVRSYPYADTYRVWPGPNSNTFTAHVLRAVPELKADLPPTAIGKDYLGSGLVAKTPSGTGFQLSLFGVLGLLAGFEEGLELNVLGLTLGIDPRQLALKLPLVGSVGWRTECEAVSAACGAVP
jgi:hypothetical protein